MKLVAFGDSFIQPSPHNEEEKLFRNHSNYTECYEGILARYYNTVPNFMGVPGSGPWSMFMNFIQYMETVDDEEYPDVVLFAWSEPSRLYHKEYVINSGLASQDRRNWDQDKIDTMDAALDYYRCLLDTNKNNYDLRALMLYTDELTKNYPNVKFVHMYCWSIIEDMYYVGWHNHYREKKLDELDYGHTFKNGVQIRPPLMYLSMLDEWPSDLARDPRTCHLSKNMHIMLGKALKECINDYAPGKIVDVELGWFHNGIG
jgi:hypothetical protein